MKVAYALLLAILASVSTADAQQASWIATDDPGLPILEHLILRGEVRDPSPQVRPIRRGTAVRALRGASCGTGSWCLEAVRRLLAEWNAAESHRAASLAGRIGAQGETAARRDPLWPAGAGRTIEGLGDAMAMASSGALLAQARVSYDPRAVRDPDRGTATFSDIRLAEAVIDVSLPFGSATFGKLVRSWGPADAEGTARSASGYPETSFAFDLGGERLHFSAIASRLDDAIADDGAPVYRWLGMHRLDVVPSARLALALWETAVAQGERRSADDALYGVLNTLAFDQAFGRRQQRNSIIGADVTWQGPRMRLEGQFALDDWRSLAPPRYAWVVGAGGRLADRYSWRVTWARVSSLAYRTSDPRENFLYNGVSLGPIIPDHDLFRLSVGIPVSAGIIVHPEVAALVQGEGRIQMPFPPYDSLGTATGFLQGIVQRTVRLSLRAEGRAGPFFLSGDGGLNIDRNANNVAGVSRTHFEGRIALSIGASRTWSEQ